MRDRPAHSPSQLSRIVRAATVMGGGVRSVRAATVMERVVREARLVTRAALTEGTPAYCLKALASGSWSVRKGVAGRPAPLQRLLPAGLMAQA